MSIILKSYEWNNLLNFDNSGYRYAALNLAMLHYKFGHYKEARAAVHESIRMAQDANDHICLQHALVSGNRKWKNT